MRVAKTSSYRIRIDVRAAASSLLRLPEISETASAVSQLDACGLLSLQQVAMALGVEVDAGRNMIGAGDCRSTERGKRLDIRRGYPGAAAQGLGCSPFTNVRSLRRSCPSARPAQITTAAGAVSQRRAFAREHRT